MAEIADKFTRNEILSPNEIRAEIGYKPDKDPKSDELRNRNINQNSDEVKETETLPNGTEESEDVKGAPGNGSEDSINELIKIISGE